MGEYTSKYNLYKPSPGENGYASKMRNNFDIIDGMIENTIATTSALGVVKVGNGLGITADGTLSEQSVATVSGNTLIFKTGSAEVSGNTLIIQ